MHQPSLHRSLLVLLAIGVTGLLLTSLRLLGQQSDDLVQQGVTAAKQGDNDSAMTFYNEALRLDPQNLYALNDRAQVFREKGDFDKAIADCNTAIRIDPSFAPPYANRGNVYSDKGELDKAMEGYNHAIQLGENDTWIFCCRSTCAIALHKYDLAVADCTKALQIDPNFESAYYNRADAYEDMGEYVIAKADYNQAILLNPQHFSAYNNLAWILITCPQIGLRDGLKAVELATHGCELAQWQDPNLEDTLAAAYAEAGDFKNAVKWESLYLKTPKLESSDRADAARHLAHYQSRQSALMSKSVTRQLKVTPTLPPPALPQPNFD